MFVVCDNDKIQTNHIAGAPDIVIEELSPSTVKNDRNYKKNLYGNVGVKEYWIVDTNNKCIEIYGLVNGIFTFVDLYIIHSEYELNKMTEEARSTVKHKFKSIIFADL